MMSNSWEPESNLQEDVPKLIKEYNDNHKEKKAKQPKSKTAKKPVSKVAKPKVDLPKKTPIKTKTRVVKKPKKFDD